MNTIEDFLVALRKDEPWRARGECVKRAIPLEVFFPEQGKPSAEARAICAACPVRVECADFARRTGSHYGVWGGVNRGGRTKKAPPARTKEQAPTVTILPESPASERNAPVATEDPQRDSSSHIRSVPRPLQGRMDRQGTAAPG